MNAPVNEVIVGNIGTVYSGDDAVAAHRAYIEYRDQSVHGYGRAAGEPVTWMRDGDIYIEHVPHGSRDED